MSRPIGPAPSSRRCYYCGHDRVQRWGTFSGRQRYRCTACSRTFSTFTGTPLYYLKRIDRWEAFARAMDEALPLRATARRLRLHKDTVFRWRHRILAAIEALPQQLFRGVVAVGDAPFRYNHKGRPSDESSPNPMPGARYDRPRRVWVLIALNGSAGHRALLLDRGRVRAEDLVHALKGRVDSKAVVVGGNGRYSPVAVGARRLQLDYVAPSPGGDGQLGTGFMPSYIWRLRRWLARFRGVATRYLTRYLQWFHALHVGPGLTRWSLLIALKDTGRA